MASTADMISFSTRFNRDSNARFSFCASRLAAFLASTTLVSVTWGAASAKRLPAANHGARMVIHFSFCTIRFLLRADKYPRFSALLSRYILKLTLRQGDIL